MAERLAKLDIFSIEDLLFHLPSRYQDRTRVVPIGSLRPGDEVVVQGEVQLTEIKFGKRRMLLSRISDGTGSLTLRFFHFNAAQKAALSKGAFLRCYGEVRTGSVTLEMIHPEYHLVQSSGQMDTAECLTPIYPTTEGLHQLTFRNLTEQALRQLAGAQVAELIPPQLFPTESMPSLAEALAQLHRPAPDSSLEALAEGRHPAQLRLIFEELLANQLSLRQLRHEQQGHQAAAMQGAGELSKQFKRQLPFSLTHAQQRVVDEIDRDLQLALPMQRLVQGDVGSGKTVVAALAAIQVVACGFQVAVMAPTEILAEQHYQNFCNWLSPLGLEVVWLSGRQKAAERKQAIEDIQEKQAAVVVGTHALFQEAVVFNGLGLVIVDEQHRFGVHQRLALREKGAAAGCYPHQLIMTATPIPRTLAMTAYADLDCSVIDELPPGRTPVETVVLPDSRRPEVVQRVRGRCKEGRQAYWVCTLIEESEVLQCEAAEDTATMLAEALPELQVGLVHGRMKPVDKEQVMSRFKAGELDLLVATTVIEVGVDVPNASVMVIENAERLGLAQLHQLRGRVGRGSAASSCVLMYHGKLSNNGRERLAVMRESSDGFVIAQKDLEIRGPGEVLGTRQTGVWQLRVADLVRDQYLLPKVSEAADWLVSHEPQRMRPLIDRWVGSAVRYGEV